MTLKDAIAVAVIWWYIKDGIMLSASSVITKDQLSEVVINVAVQECLLGLEHKELS